MLVLMTVLVTACGSFGAKEPDADADAGVDAIAPASDAASADAASEAGPTIDSGVPCILEQKFDTSLAPTGWTENKTVGSTITYGTSYVEMTTPVQGRASLTSPLMLPRSTAHFDLVASVDGASLIGPTAYIELFTLECTDGGTTTNAVLTYDDRGFVLETKYNGAGILTIAAAKAVHHAIRIDLEETANALIVDGTIGRSAANGTPLARTCQVLLGVNTSDATTTKVQVERICAR